MQLQRKSTEGNLYRIDGSTRSNPETPPLLETNSNLESMVSSCFGEYFDLSEYGHFGKLRIDRKELYKISKDHQNSIRELNRNLSIFSKAVMTVYALV